MFRGSKAREYCNSFANVETPQRCHLSHGNGRIYRAAHQAFHHNFKSVTSTSPLQYLKTYRLHKARMLMIHDGMKASAAAMRVGYESASQFSREFKRYFGVTPGEDASRIRTMQGA